MSTRPSDVQAPAREESGELVPMVVSYAHHDNDEVHVWYRTEVTDRMDAVATLKRWRTFAHEHAGEERLTTEAIMVPREWAGTRVSMGDTDVKDLIDITDAATMRSFARLDYTDVVADWLVDWADRMGRVYQASATEKADQEFAAAVSRMVYLTGVAWRHNNVLEQATDRDVSAEIDRAFIRAYEEANGDKGSAMRPEVARAMVDGIVGMDEGDEERANMRSDYTDVAEREELTEAGSGVDDGYVETVDPSDDDDPYWPNADKQFVVAYSDDGNGEPICIEQCSNDNHALAVRDRWRHAMEQLGWDTVLVEAVSAQSARNITDEAYSIIDMPSGSFHDLIPDLMAIRGVVRVEAESNGGKNNPHGNVRVYRGDGTGESVSLGFGFGAYTTPPGYWGGDIQSTLDRITGIEAYRGPFGRTYTIEIDDDDVREQTDPEQCVRYDDVIRRVKEWALPPVGGGDHDDVESTFIVYPLNPRQRGKMLDLHGAVAWLHGMGDREVYLEYEDFMSEGPAREMLQQVCDDYSVPMPVSGGDHDDEDIVIDSDGYVTNWPDSTGTGYRSPVFQTCLTMSEIIDGAVGHIHMGLADTLGLLYKLGDDQVIVNDVDSSSMYAGSANEVADTIKGDYNVIDQRDPSDDDGESDEEEDVSPWLAVYHTDDGDLRMLGVIGYDSPGAAWEALDRVGTAIETTPELNALSASVIALDDASDAWDWDHVSDVHEARERFIATWPRLAK